MVQHGVMSFRVAQHCDVQTQCDDTRQDETQHQTTADMAARHDIESHRTMLHEGRRHSIIAHVVVVYHVMSRRAAVCVL